MNFPDLLFFALLALLVFGPRRLPEIARVVGKTMGELRRASNEFKISLEEEIRNIDYQESIRKAQSSLPAADAETREEASEPVSHHEDYSVSTDPYEMMAGRYAEMEDETPDYSGEAHGLSTGEEPHEVLPDHDEHVEPPAHQEHAEPLTAAASAEPAHAAAVPPAEETLHEHERPA